MLKKYGSGALVVVLFFITFSQVITTSTNATVPANISTPPTPAPSPTPGPPSTFEPFEGPYLDKPLTKEQAVQKAFAYDKKWAVWD